MRWRIFVPCAAKNIKWISGNAVDSMICRDHDKFRTRSYLTKLSDYQPITKFRIIEQNIILFKVSWGMTIIVVCVIPNKNIWSFNNIFYKTRRFISIWKNFVGIWYI